MKLHEWPYGLGRTFLRATAGVCARLIRAKPAIAQMRHRDQLALSDVIESIPEGFVIYDADDRFVMCNDVFRRIYPENAETFVPGTRYEEIMRAALAVGRYPEATGREEEWLAEWMRKHRHIEASVESQLANGRWILVSERRMANGGVAGLRIDITALKTVQNALSESRVQLSKMAEELHRGKENLLRAQRITHTGSIVRDFSSAAAVEFSEEMYRLLDMDPAEPPPTKERFLQLIHPDDRIKLIEPTREAEREHATQHLDIRFMRADGSVRWLHNIAETVFDPAGRPVYHIATFTDVTEKRTAERAQEDLDHSLRMAKEAAEAANRAVQASKEDLERRVAERTQELHEAQNELIKKERLSALGQLTATVAHELRNPISAIRNTAYAIRESLGAELPRFERPLARLERSIVRCNNLISDLLYFTRPKEPKLLPTRFDEWLDGILNDHKVAAPITLERQLGAASARVALDSDQFERVMLNLIENAVQAISNNAASNGQEIIAVSTTATGRGVHVWIQDQGPGIAADVLPHIFEPLFTTKSFGTGLGLPTVKQIIEQHGGAIEVASDVGQGTTVHVSLPAIQIEAAAA